MISNQGCNCNLEPVNDPLWSCNVSVLLEKDIKYSNYIRFLEEFAKKSLQSDIKILTPKDLGTDKSLKKEKNKGKKKKNLTEEESKEQSQLITKKRAEQIKTVILKLKSSDLNTNKMANSQNRNAVADTPVYNPNKQIILSGFYEPQLLLEMVKIRIPLTCIIALGEERDEIENIDKNNDLINNLKPQSSETTVISTATSSVKKTGEYKNKNYNETSISFTFLWKNLQELLQLHENKDLTSNIIIVPCYISSILNDLNNSDLKPTERGKILFEHIVMTLNEIQKHIKQHFQYISTMKEMQVDDKVSSLNEMLLYETMIELIPLECTTVDVILHCMIEQVVFIYETLQTKQYTQNGTTDSNFSINQVFQSTSEDSKEENQTNETPILINNNDKVRMNTFHINIPEIDFEQINHNILTKMPFFKLWNLYPEQNDIIRAKYNSHLQRIWKYLKPTPSNDTFQIYVHNQIFNKMRLAKVKEQTCPLPPLNITRSNPENSSMKVENYSDDVGLSNDTKCSKREPVEIIKPFSPEYRAKIRQEEISKLINFLNCEEIFNLELKRNADTENLSLEIIIEEMKTKPFLQALHSAFSDFSQMNCNYYPPTDKLLFWFHNELENKTTIQLTGTLPTPIGFRDYYYYFISEENTSGNGQSKLLPFDNNPTNSYIEGDENEQEHNCRIDSKYHSELIPINNVEYHPLLRCTNQNEPYLRVGFNLGPTLVQVTELRTSIYGETGNSIHLKTNEWNQQKGKNIILIVEELGNYLTYNYMLDKTSEENLPTIFNLETYNGIIFTLFQRNIPMSEHAANKDSITSIHSKSSRTKSKTTDNRIEKENLENNIFNNEQTHFDLRISLPNGLTVELIRGDEPYIKQKYTVKGPTCDPIWEEDCRLYMNNGTVLIFKLDGDVVILYSNSTAVNVKRLKKIIPTLPQVQEESQYPNNDNSKSKPKSKKLKSKEKNKNNKIMETNILPDLPPPVLPPEYSVQEHELLMWSGKFKKFRYNKCKQNVYKYCIRAAKNDMTELYVKRSDGTNSYYSDDGLLVIEYPDNTRITTSCFIEPELVGCDSIEDVTNTHPNQSATELNEISGELNNNDECVQFEVVSIRSLCEHPNYAAVEYCSGKWVIHLPGKVEITYFPDASYSVNIRQNVQLEVFGEKVKLSSTAEGKQHFTEVYPIQPSEPELSNICYSVDDSGNVFWIDAQGNILNETIETETNLINCVKRSRYFVSNRDLTGYEIAYSSMFKENEEQHKLANKNSSDIDLNKIETFEMPILKTKSETYLMPYLQQNRKQFKRNDLSKPLTHSLVWLFDLPKVSKSLVFENLFLSDAGKTPKKREFAECKAVIIKKTIKITPTNSDLLTIFDEVLKKYRTENDELVQRYSSYVLPDPRTEEELMQNQNLLMTIFNKNKE